MVRLSGKSAHVIVDGADRLHINLITEGPDILAVSESVVGTIVDYGKKALALGAKVLSGQCKTELHTTTTYFENGNIKSNETTMTTNCPA